MKLKNFHVLQHSKSFKQHLKSLDEIKQILKILLDEMYIPKEYQFRLIGIGVYQLTEIQTETQLSLWD